MVLKRPQNLSFIERLNYSNRRLFGAPFKKGIISYIIRL